MNKNLTVITGANSGNGKAIASKLPNEGFKLLLLDLNTNLIEQEFKSENVMFARVDVTNYDQVADVIKKAEAKFGPLQNIINNAGIMILENAHLQPKDHIDKMIDINIKGVIYVSQIALKTMIEQREGTIINIASIAGIKGFPNHSTYCATKYAVRGYSETIRAEVAPLGIRVAIISPGVVKTKLLDGTVNNQIKTDYENWRDQADAFIDATDIANSVFYILSQPKNVTIREVIVGPTTQIE